VLIVPIQEMRQYDDIRFEDITQLLSRTGVAPPGTSRLPDYPATKMSAGSPQFVGAGLH